MYTSNVMQLILKSRINQNFPQMLRDINNTKSEMRRNIDNKSVISVLSSSLNSNSADDFLLPGL